MPRVDWTDLDAFQALPRLTGLALSPDGSRLVTSVAELDPKRPARGFERLNLSPGCSAIAGLGTRVLRDRQDAPMASAWAQAADLEKSNQRLRQFRLGCMIATRLHVRHIAPWIRRATSEFAVTDRRVIMKTGVITRKTLELNLVKIESVGVDQSLLGRIFDCGTITIIGSGGTREAFPLIGSPLAFRRAVQEAIEDYTARHGVPGALVKPAEKTS